MQGVAARALDVVVAEQLPSRPAETSRLEPAALLGLAAIAAGLVVIAHLVLAAGGPLRRLPITRATGVALAFVLAGYLVTRALLDERERGRVDLRRFFTRGALRLALPAYAFMATLLALRHFGFARFTDAGLLASATWWRNLFHHGRGGDWVLDHTWAMAVLVQVMGPWALVVARASRRVALGCAIGGVVGLPLLRALRGDAWARAGIDVLDVAGSDTLFAGCLLALLLAGRARGPLLRMARTGLLAPSLLLVALHAVALLGGTRVLAPIAPTLLSLVMAWLVLAAAHGGTSGARLLGCRPLAWCGGMAYSLYLWQQLLLLPPDQPGAASLLLRFPVDLVLLAAAAAVSWALIERRLPPLRTEAPH